MILTNIIMKWCQGMVLTRTIAQWEMVKARCLQEPWCNEWWSRHDSYKNHDAVKDGQGMMLSKTWCNEWCQNKMLKNTMMQWVMLWSSAYKNHSPMSNGQGMVLIKTMDQWDIEAWYLHEPRCSEWWSRPGAFFGPTEVSLKMEVFMYILEGVSSVANFITA